MELGSQSLVQAKPFLLYWHCCDAGLGGRYLPADNLGDVVTLKGRRSNL